MSEFVIQNLNKQIFDLDFQAISDAIVPPNRTGSANTFLGFDSNGNAVSATLDPVGDATEVTKGILKLAGDLCGTADIPKIRKPDSGFDRRVCIIEFTRKFEDVPVLDFHRKKDRTLENRIKKDMELRDAFMWILIEQIKELNMDMFIMDELTENVTNEYITSLNPLLDYINDNLEAYRVSGTAKTPYKMIDVYNDYKSKVEFERLNFKDFNEAMRYNNFVSKRHKMGYVWSNLIDPKSDYGKATFNQWKLQNKKEEEKENDSNEEDDEDAETETEIDMD